MTSIRPSDSDAVSTPSDVHDIRTLTATGPIQVQPAPVDPHRR